MDSLEEAGGLVHTPLPSVNPSLDPSFPSPIWQVSCRHGSWPDPRPGHWAESSGAVGGGSLPVWPTLWGNLSSWARSQLSFSPVERASLANVDLAIFHFYSVFESRGTLCVILELLHWPLCPLNAPLRSLNWYWKIGKLPQTNDILIWNYNLLIFQKFILRLRSYSCSIHICHRYTILLVLQNIQVVHAEIFGFILQISLMSCFSQASNMLCWSSH